MSEITPGHGAGPGARPDATRGAPPDASFDPQPVRREGRHASIEPLKLRHATALFEAGSESAVWRYLPRGPFRSVADASGWVREALEDQATGAQIPFAIIDAASGKVAGSTRYLEIRPEHWGLEIGWTWLGPALNRLRAQLECRKRAFGHSAMTQLSTSPKALTASRNCSSVR